jgi:acetyl-CoA carboxylase biotin carboxyl carrier protein
LRSFFSIANRKSKIANANEDQLSKKKSTKKIAKAAISKISGSPMDLALVQQMIELMSANDLSTIEVRDGDRRVVLKRGSIAAPSGSSGSMPTQYISQHNPNPGLPSGATNIIAAPDENAGLTPIKSPMVGTFYSAASPDAPAFVQVGATVDEETDVCIIEAMKVFNNIKAETRGTIAKILVTNGQTVEFGQTLFLVKPSS